MPRSGMDVDALMRVEERLRFFTLFYCGVCCSSNEVDMTHEPCPGCVCHKAIADSAGCRREVPAHTEQGVILQPEPRGLLLRGFDGPYQRGTTTGLLATPGIRRPPVHCPPVLDDVVEVELESGLPERPRSTEPWHAIRECGSDATATAATASTPTTLGQRFVPLRPSGGIPDEWMPRTRCERMNDEKQEDLVLERKLGLRPVRVRNFSEDWEAEEPLPSPETASALNPSARQLSAARAARARALAV